MASLSMPAAVPAHSSFDTPSFQLPVKPIHARRTSRNPNLAPLPAFEFKPGAMDNERNDRQSSSPEKDLGEEGHNSGPARKSPPALPTFCFNPGASLPQEEKSPSPTHPILEEMAQNRSRRTSRPAALPSFSFNPGSKEQQTTPSPTKSSFAAETPGSTRSVGHRRGGSEFIGTTEGSQPSGSPPFALKAQENSLTPPLSGQSTRPRFSHQHRRSQAVSITEIETSDLIKASAVTKHRAGSLPSTPTDLPSNDHFSRASQSISNLYGRTPPSSPRRRSSTASNRPRVGFSETVDVIPRPLSMISSETEGSTSTIRGAHSITGSITSLGSPPARSTPSPSLDDGSPAKRPNTADAVSPSQHITIKMDESLGKCGLPKRPHSASDSPSMLVCSESPAHKKRFWFGAGYCGETSPKMSPTQTLSVENGDPISSLMSAAPGMPAEGVKPSAKVSSDRKSNIKKRKVRSIAGSIFSRKARSRATQSRLRRSPTPPLGRSFRQEATDTVFDDDNTVVIRTSPSPALEHSQASPSDTQLQSQRPPSRRGSECDESVTSPVIDLDAALGPFGSEEKLPQTGFAAARSRMHSSVGRGMTDAFGVMHRRTESAPQMPPFNRNTPGLHRLASNSNVAADVFDEEEEDDFLAEEGKPKAQADVTEEQDPSSLGLGNAVKPKSRASSRSPIGLAISTQVPDGIEIVDIEGEVGRGDARSSDSTLTGVTVPEPGMKERTSDSMAFAYPAPQTSYASSGEGRSAPSSAIPSPDADHVNFDGYPRFSRHIGEPSPDIGLRFSTDDVPSLCDSVSTGNAPRMSSGAATQSSADHRSGSFSAPCTGRAPKPPQAWKRASLASLNKLISGSSHGERSRLRFEDTVDHEQEEKARKKGNRISRLMSFWRSKERESK